MRGVFDVMKLKSKITIIYEDFTRDDTVYFIEAEKKNEHVEWFLFIYSSFKRLN